MLNVTIGALALFQYAKNEETRRFAGYEEVIRSIEAGNLRPDADGDIRLPTHLSWLTDDGHVYEWQHNSRDPLWLFPTSVSVHHTLQKSGKVTDHRVVSGYVYSPDQLPPSYMVFSNFVGIRLTEPQQPANSPWFFAEPCGY